MSKCTCECRGFCPVLGVAVTEQLRQVCIKDHAKAVKVAESLKVDRKQKAEDRQRNARESLERQRRLISWLKLYRQPTDKGVGDVADRISKQFASQPQRIAKQCGGCKSRDKTDISRLLLRLLCEWTCNRRTAVSRLNKQHPY